MPRTRSSNEFVAVHKARATQVSKLECLIGLKTAELYAAEDLLRPKPVAWAALAPMRPDEWVQRLIEVKLLRDYAGRLSESFEALVRDAHVPRQRCRAKNISDTG
jgi:hypothetical protein